MRIVHLNTSGPGGGAGRAAYRLHTALRRQGYDSTYVGLRRIPDEPEVVGLHESTGLMAPIRLFLHRRRKQLALFPYRKTRRSGDGPFSDGRAPYTEALLNRLRHYDLVHLHWVARYVDHRLFPQLAGLGIPLVWTLHDMNPFTGGCHYDAGCGKHRMACGACPHLGSHFENDLSRQVWQRKARVLARLSPRDLHVVSPSRWLAEEARASALFGRFPISVIPYGLDTTVFSPTEKRAARAALGIPQDQRVLMFASHDLGAERKGLRLLLEALENIESPDELFLLTIGRGQPPGISVTHRHLNFIGDEKALAAVYSAADLFVIPSLLDNLPNTVLEAMACGTPSVAFPVGGLPDMVRPGRTGFLAPEVSALALGQTIIEALSDPLRLAQLAINCRQVAVEEYSLHNQAAAYLRIYKQLLSNDA